MKSKYYKYIIGFAIFLSIFIFMFIGANFVAYFLGIFGSSMPMHGTLVSSLIFAIPVVIASFYSRLAMKAYSKKYNVTATPLNRILVLILIIGYVLTAINGAQAVKSFNTEWALKEHARIKVPEKFDTPYNKTYFAFPVLPFVVLSYQEYQLASLYGEGRWDIHLWYLFGVKRQIIFPIWIS